ncbi:MAG: hypothetical protein K8R74_04320 [Bacteroidales bacterium]|nr:hypothetical protein [Bacteroidales bacterium]
MDINAKKVEIIQHILIIQKTDTIRKIDQFIRDLEYEEDDGFYTKKRKDDEESSGKEKIKPVNEAKRKIKSILNMYGK